MQTWSLRVIRRDCPCARAYAGGAYGAKPPEIPQNIIYSFKSNPEHFFISTNYI